MTAVSLNFSLLSQTFNSTATVGSPLRGGVVMKLVEGVFGKVKPPSVGITSPSTEGYPLPGEFSALKEDEI